MAASTSAGQELSPGGSALSERTSRMGRREPSPVLPGRRVPIIAMTAQALVGDRERCLAAGMDDYVAQPINANELFAAIDRVMLSAAQLSS
jgi:CheY-like chemotaxis protein